MSTTINNLDKIHKRFLNRQKKKALKSRSVIQDRGKSYVLEFIKLLFAALALTVAP